MKIGIATTANPDGTYIEHRSSFNPTGKAIERNGLFIIPITNQLKKSENTVKTRKLKIA